MVSENEFMSGVAEIILSVFDEKILIKSEVCRDGHFAPGRMTASQLLHMKSDTLMRLLLYYGMALTPEEHKHLFARLQHYIVTVANFSDNSADAIIDSHAGSPIMQKCNGQRK